MFTSSGASFASFHSTASSSSSSITPAVGGLSAGAIGSIIGGVLGGFLLLAIAVILILLNRQCATASQGQERENPDLISGVHRRSLSRAFKRPRPVLSRDVQAMSQNGDDIELSRQSRYPTGGVPGGGIDTTESSFQKGTPIGITRPKSRPPTYHE
jgi:hypothetical protein